MVKTNVKFKVFFYSVIFLKKYIVDSEHKPQILASTRH